MCLFFVAVPTVPNVVGADRLSRVTGLSVSKQAGALHFSFGGRGCGCPLLTKTADFSAEFWDLAPEVLPLLESALSLLGKEAQGFTLSALWAGDTIESESTVPLHAFLQELRSNHVRNAHLYRVTP